MGKQDPNEPYSGSAVQVVNPWTSQVNNDFDCDEFKFKVKKEEIITDPNLSLGELQPILADILAGDSVAMERPEFKCLNFDLIKKALDWLVSTDSLTDTTKKDLVLNPWRLNFKERPPTPEEFLTEKYVGSLAESIYPHIKKWFIEMLDPTKPFRDTILCSYIGSGKSYITNLLNLYIATHYAMMYSPHRFFGLSPATVFVLSFGSFSQKKASEIYVEPLQQVLESCSFFEKVRTHEALHKKDLEMSETGIVDKVYYTNATPTSALQFSNNLNVKTISSANQIIGMTLLSFALTELSFFYENGWTDEKIMRLFTKGKQRISSRLHGNYYGRSILDSSPGSLENEIDRYIWQDAPKSKLNYIAKGARWDIVKDEYPTAYDADGNKRVKDWTVMFPLFTGSSGKPPSVVNTQMELDLIDEADVIWVPRRSVHGEDLLEQAEQNPLEFMRDFGGLPVGVQERIFYDKTVLDNIFDNNMKNIDVVLTADYLSEPEHLIWNQVKHILFNKIVDTYQYHYKPDLIRAIGIDQAYAEDLCSIAMGHVERDPNKIDPETGEPVTVYVVDFTLNLHRGQAGQLNLDAIKFFIVDLIQLGQLRIGAVAFDQFQSVSAQQYLKRASIQVEYVSVDKTTTPYLTMIDLIFKNRVYSGKNTILLNNLKSLQMVKRKTGKGSFKVDHTMGEVPLTGHDAGKNAKDTSDSVCSMITLLTAYPTKFVPMSLWSSKIIERTYDSVKSNLFDTLNLRGFNV